MSKEIILGATYRDKITDFEGVCTGFVQYLTGCNQALLVGKVSHNGGEAPALWFDQQRLSIVAEREVIQLDNGSTPGFDKAAPIR